MLKSFFIAFSLYSAIPMPQVRWNEKNMKYSLCFFPFVGILIALVTLLCYRLCNYLEFGSILTAGILTVIPFILSGGIHFDGFLDTTDALCSHRSREEKLEILKDPHTGAFALMHGILYILLVFCFLTEAEYSDIIIIASGYVLSRVLSAVSAVIFPKARKDGMLFSLAQSTDRKVLIVLFIELFIAAFFMAGSVKGIISLFMALLAFVCYRFTALKNFGGVTGDTSGYFTQVCELVIIISAVLSGRILA